MDILPSPSLASSTPAAHRRILGELLLASGAISPTTLERALNAQRDSGVRLGELLVRMQATSEEVVYRALARQLGLTFTPPPLHPDPAALRMVSGAFARSRRCLPLALLGRALQVAMQDPLDLRALDDLQFLSGRRVEVVVVPPTTLIETLSQVYPDEVEELVRGLPKRSPSGGELPGAPSSVGGTMEGVPVRQSREPMVDSPVSRLVDHLLRRAIEGGASDLHIEHRTDDVVVRERIDGVLRRVTELPPGARESLLSRIKVMAQMDIAVRHRPQDGGFAFNHGGGRLGVRVSTLPVEGGEKAVLRILDPRAAPTGLDQLGFAPEDLSRLRALLGSGRGVLLTAGPTGSGKSSTLFGALLELPREAMNIVTLEDPIEYRVEGINQVQMAPGRGLTFPTALRSVLRQDPDVLMVGEIRDRETAEIAMSAAITGHLVLSTIHTVDAPSGILRLLQMGVPPHLVAGGLTGIVAQRLVRRACRGCGGRPGGCGSCHDGYRGRCGVFQILTVTEALREVIARGGDAGELRRRAEEGGMGSLGGDVRRKIAEGITTPHEAARVIRESPGDGLPCARCGSPLPFDAEGCPGCGLPSRRRCGCGRTLQRSWRFCAGCLRRVEGPPS